MASNEYEATEAIQFAIREFEKIIALHKPDKKRARVNDKVAGVAYYMACTESFFIIYYSNFGCKLEFMGNVELMPKSILKNPNVYEKNST